MTDIIENKDTTVDETSKPDAGLNVEQPTSPAKATEPSKDTENVQKAVQDQVKLRKEAEEKAMKANLAADEAKKQLQEREAELIETKKQGIIKDIKARLDKSVLPQAYKDRIVKDPVKWFLAHTDSKAETWEQAEKLVAGELDGLVGSLEKELIVATPQNKPFVDTDNPQYTTPDGKISVEKLRKMSPYDIAKLPEDVKQQLRKAGDTVSSN